MIFRNYTVAISRSDLIECTEAALGDILAHADQLREKIGTPREYAWGTVELTIYPRKSMQWVEFSYAVSSIRTWLNMYDSVDMDFDVMINGRGIVGTGRLGSVI